MKKLLVIANPNAGKINKGGFKDLIFKEFSEKYKTDLHFTRYKGDAKDTAKKLINDYDVFVIFGGDGSINEIGRSLLYSGKPLGIIPGGSGNGLAKGLKIPTNIQKAIDIIKNERIIEIDTGKLNDDYFFNIGGIGLDAWISKDFNDKPLGRGIPPYVLYAIINYITMPPFLSEIEIDDSKKKIIPETILLTFSNFKEWGGSAYIAPHANPSDTYLDLCIVENFPLPLALVNLNKLFNKKIDKFKYYQTYKFKKLKVRTPSPQIYHYDGEKGKWASTFEVEALPLSLKVIVPENY